MANALKPDELDALRAIDSPTIANAIEYFSVRPRVAGYCGTNVRNLTPEAGVMLGYAVTCRGDSTTEDKDRREQSLGMAVLAYVFVLRVCHGEIVSGKPWSIFQLQHALRLRVMTNQVEHTVKVTMGKTRKAA